MRCMSYPRKRKVVLAQYVLCKKKSRNQKSPIRESHSFGPAVGRGIFCLRKDQVMEPRHLYKYQTINSQNIENLKNEVIWLPKPSKFNDPFDCRIKFSGKNQYFESLPIYLN